MDIVHNHLDWPAITADSSAFIGYGRHNTLQSNQYATNLINHVTMNVWTYIQHTIKSFCQLHGYQTSKKSPFIKELMDGIKDPTYVFTVTHVRQNITNKLIRVDEARRDQFIYYHRDYLMAKNIDLSGDEESGNTIKEQAQKLVLYFVHLLNYQNQFEENDDVNTKLFYPVPVHGIKCYHMEVDGEILYYLLKDCGVALPRHSDVDLKNMNAPYFVRDGLHVNFFNEYFSVQEFESGRKYFNYSNGISTDNVSISVILKKDETIEAGVPQRRKKRYRHLAGTFPI